MKPALISFLFAFLAANAAEIPKDTHVLLKMVNSISTRTAQEGTQVYMQTASPISDGNRIIGPWVPKCRGLSSSQGAAEKCPAKPNWRSVWKY